MWKEFFEYAKQVFALHQETQKNKASIQALQDDLKEARQEIKELTDAVRRLAYEIHRVGEDDRHEREKLVLQLENEMLKFERRLLTGQSKDKDAE